jgi:hypothetical protein
MVTHSIETELAQALLAIDACRDAGASKRIRDANFQQIRL